MLDIFYETGYSNGVVNGKWNLKENVTSACAIIKSFFKLCVKNTHQTIKKSQTLTCKTYNLPRQVTCFLQGWDLKHKEKIQQYLSDQYQTGDPWHSWSVQAKVEEQETATPIPAARELTLSNQIRAHFDLPRCTRVENTDLARAEEIAKHNAMNIDGRQLSTHITTRTPNLRPDTAKNLSQWIHVHCGVTCNWCHTFLKLKKLIANAKSPCPSRPSVPPVPPLIPT